MNYPLISEYVEAIKSAEDNFEELNYLRPVLGDDGLPVMTSGNFAVVFKMKDENSGKYYAVKCFTKEQEGRAEAYCEITKELQNVKSQYLVSLRYIEKELFVDTDQTEEEEFPVLLMDWVEGMPLDIFIRDNCDEMKQYDKDSWKYKSRLHTFDTLAYNFSQLATWLKLQPFAHGDLKPDNILVQENGELVLVDYDGIYVPSMKGQKSRELGSLDFRHPYRTENHFDENIDNFPLATILLSLEAISCNFEYYTKYSAPDRLLFSEKDYKNIEKCELIKKLLKEENKVINKTTYNFIEELLMVFDFLPFINSDVHTVYGYKKEGKFVVCNDSFKNITNDILDLNGETIVYQAESAYSKNVGDEKKYVTLLIDRQCNISVKLSEESIFFVPRLFTPFKYRHVDILVKGDIREHLIGENYMNQDFLILKGKRYNHIKYLLTLDKYHLLGKFDTNGNIQEYYLIGADEKVYFHSKDKESFILMASQFGGFDLVCQNEEEIWYYNSGDRLKKYKRDKVIDLAKAHVHKDKYSKLIITNHPLYTELPLWYFESEMFEKKQTNWLIALYGHSRTKHDTSGSYNVSSFENDLKQVVLHNSMFYGYRYGFLEYKTDYNKKPYILYNSNGDYYGISEQGNVFETGLSIVRKYDYDTDRRIGLFKLSKNKQIVPNNFNDIDYRIVDNNVVSIVLIRNNVMKLYGVFLNERVILPIKEYDEVKFNGWTSRFICVRENEDTDVKKLYKWDGTYITDYKYTVAPFRYYDSWQEECYSNTILKVYDKDYDREYKNEEKVFRLCINDKMIDDNYYKSVVWCQTFEDWQHDVHDMLQCESSNGKCGIFHVDLNKWVVPTEYDSIKFDRSFGIPVIILDGKILLNSNYEEVFSGEELKIINYSWIYAIKDIASNRYVFYCPIKGEVIEDLQQVNGVISSNYFQFSIADEKYLWLKELEFETNDSNDINKDDNDNQ